MYLDDNPVKGFYWYFLCFLQVSMSMESKWIASDAQWSCNPNAACFNYIISYHFG